MTEILIHGGPDDGASFDVAGELSRGELVTHEGSRFRVYHRTDGRWVGIWVGYEPGVRSLGSVTVEGLRFNAYDLVDDEDRIELTPEQAERLRAMVDEAPEPMSWTTITAAAVLAAGFDVALVAVVGLLTWAAVGLRAIVSDWTTLALWTAGAAFVVTLAAGAVSRRRR